MIQHDEREVVTEMHRTPVRRYEETVHHDAVIDRRVVLYRWTQTVYLLFGVFEALIAIRFFLRLFGANSAAPFSSFIYGITSPFIAPFVGVFGTVSFEGAVFEPHSLLAIAVYALLSWLLVKMIWIVWDDDRVIDRHSVHRHEEEPPLA